MRALQLPLVVLSALASAACITSRPIGPRTVEPSMLGFNQAIVSTEDRQLLLNLVRLRYRDNPLFLEVSSVVSQHSRGLSGGLDAEVELGGNDLILPGLSGSISESPVVTLSPLRGADYARRLLEPVDPATVIGLSFAGWSLERLLVCCVQELNGITNAPTAAGPTPELAPVHGDFQRLAVLLRRLQLDGMLRVAIDHEGTIYVEVSSPPDDGGRATLEETRQLLGLPAGTSRLTFGPPMLEPPPGQLSLMPRSVLAVAYFLSQGVEVPEEHERQGLVTVTRDPGGGRFDWDTVLLGMFRVHAGAEAPAGATLKVRYRGHWFWIDDSDLNTKTTFNLLSMLFSLEGSNGQKAVPLLTIG